MLLGMYGLKLLYNVETNFWNFKNCFSICLIEENFSQGLILESSVNFSKIHETSQNLKNLFTKLNPFHIFHQHLCWQSFHLQKNIQLTKKYVWGQIYHSKVSLPWFLFSVNTFFEHDFLTLSLLSTVCYFQCYILPLIWKTSLLQW